MGADDPRGLLTVLLLAALALLLAVPLVFFGAAVLRRALGRNSRRAGDSRTVDRQESPWETSASRTATPTAREIEQQFGPEGGDREEEA